jgi:hypothetical protein
MAKFSELYPLSTGGGSANIAGFEWFEKSSDFTAEPNKAYYCDTALGDILMTLPYSPSNGDEVGFLLIGANKLNITTTDKIKGTLQTADSPKQVNTNYLLIIFFYVDNVTGWDWDARYDSIFGDPFILDVVLLIKGQGLNNSTAIVDSSPTPKTITIAGNTKISTTQSKYGGSSLYFDGLGDYLTISNANLALETGDFTIEFWARSEDVSSANQKGFFQISPTGIKDYYLNSLMVYQGANGTTGDNGGITLMYNSAFSSGGANKLFVNRWFHVAITRNSGTLRAFVDGVLFFTTTNTTNYTGSVLEIGGYYEKGTIYFDYKGFLSHFRVTKSCRYKTNFNPETDTFLNN